MNFKKYIITLIRKEFGKKVKYSLFFKEDGSTEKIKATVNCMLRTVEFSDKIKASDAFDLLIQELVIKHQKIIEQNQNEIDLLKSLKYENMINANNL